MTKKTVRVDSVSRLIAASPQTIYRAFIDPTSLASWLPPTGMKCQLQEFDPREGGGYRMTLTYEQPEHPVAGKASEHSDVVEVRFVTLVPDQRIVQVVEFESEDPAFAGAMTMTWSLTPVRGGTEVSIRCGNVPEGIRKEDHDQGLRSSLENLAAFTE
jgi:uncharacterized protein YndB with AHSA1/START domain